jgi:asparagine synthetase A
MTEIEAFNQLNEPDWEKEVTLALMKHALPIAADPTHPNNAYAKSVVNNVSAFVQRFQLALLTEIDVSATSKKQIVDEVSKQVFDTHIDIDAKTTADAIAKHFAAFA